MKNQRSRPTRRHTRRLERLEERQLAEQAKRAERDTRRDTRKGHRAATRTHLANSRALVATLTAIALSIAVAVPSQMQWFLQQLTGGHWTFPGSLVAVVATLLIEGLCWLGAFLYADSVSTTPVRLYRGTTFLFAGIAASINYSHGATSNWKVGVVYAIASLMGVGAWELYMHRTRHVASGMTAEEIKLWALRWRKHPAVMREAGRLRATFGTSVPLEVAWRMAYVRKVGNPTVPIALTDPMISRLFVSEGGNPDVEDAVTATDNGVVELAIDWESLHTPDDVIRQFWPEVQDIQSSGPDGGITTLDIPRSTSNPEPPRRNSTSSTQPLEQSMTSGNGPSARKWNSATPRSAGARPAPTKTELGGDGDAKSRILKYLTRVEDRGVRIAELDRQYVAEQFHVTTRYVRSAIKEHLELKEQPR